VLFRPLPPSQPDDLGLILERREAAEPNFL
jgi:hypothetical protein